MAGNVTSNTEVIVGNSLPWGDVTSNTEVNELRTQISDLVSVVKQMAIDQSLPTPVCGVCSLT